MGVFSKELEKIVSEGSPIRKVMALDGQLRSEGKKPINLSIGNPNIGPGINFYLAYFQVIGEGIWEFLNGRNPHGYTDSAGLLETRARIADDLNGVLGTSFSENHLYVTAGAVAALDIVNRCLLGSDNAKDGEAIIIAPYFPQYLEYIKNCGGKAVLVDSKPDFSLDIEKIGEAITQNTKYILINSPNNPTGKIYDESSLRQLAEKIQEKNQEYGITIVVIEDMPYRNLDPQHKFVSMQGIYKNTISVESLSKTDGIAGERFGWFAVNPEFGTEKDRELAPKIFRRGILDHHVNGPVTLQRVIAKLGITPSRDLSQYSENLEILYQALIAQGFKVQPPEGAFYLFAEIPERYATAEQFYDVAMAGDEPLLYVPGQAFGKNYSRHIRIGACVSKETVNRAVNRIMAL
jgi:aspartate aminotransferase